MNHPDPRDAVLADDPFYYGYRDVPVTRADGTVERVRRGLTLEDLLHPEEDDRPMNSNLHNAERRYLADVFRTRLAGDPSALVLEDTGVVWDVEGLRHHAPDVCAIFGVREPGRFIKSFDVAEEGTRPRVIVELVSPSYRVNDVDTKYEQYHAARVEWYVIVDRVVEGGPASVVGYRYAPDGYQALAPDDRGWLWLEPIDLWVGVVDGGVACYAPDGTKLGDHTELNAALEEARKALAAADARTAELEERVEAETEARLAEAVRWKAADAKRKEEARRRKEETRKRQEAEQQRKEAEDRAAAAEERMRQLEAELARLRGTA